LAESRSWMKIPLSRGRMRACLRLTHESSSTMSFIAAPLPGSRSPRRQPTRSQACRRMSGRSLVVAAAHRPPAGRCSVTPTACWHLRAGRAAVAVAGPQRRFDPGWRPHRQGQSAARAVRQGDTPYSAAFRGDRRRSRGASVLPWQPDPTRD
jgi:hypothetical protein